MGTSDHTRLTTGVGWLRWFLAMGTGLVVGMTAAATFATLEAAVALGVVAVEAVRLMPAIPAASRGEAAPPDES
jgi:hypothetical protein